MLLYNVTIKIDADVADEWVAWMKSSHMPRVMQTGLFVENLLLRIVGDDNDDGITFAAQYHCENMTNYQHYQQTFAPALQAETKEKYAGKFAAFRTLMEIL